RRLSVPGAYTTPHYIGSIGTVPHGTCSREHVNTQGNRLRSTSPSFHREQESFLECPCPCTSRLIGMSVIVSRTVSAAQCTSPLSLPKPPVPRPSPQATPAARPSPILRGLSRAAPLSQPCKSTRRVPCVTPPAA